MAEQQKTGDVKAPQIPEGTMYLFVLYNPKTSEYACTFSGLTDGLALHSMAGTSLESEKQRAFTPVAPFSVAPPMGGLPGGFDLSKLRWGH